MTSNQVDVAFDCPIPIPDQSNIETEYSDDFTRNKIAPIVAGSYAKTNEEILGCLNNHFDGPVIYKTYTVPCPGINVNVDERLEKSVIFRIHVLDILLLRKRRR